MYTGGRKGGLPPLGKEDNQSFPSFYCETQDEVLVTTVKGNNKDTSPLHFLQRDKNGTESRETLDETAPAKTERSNDKRSLEA